MFRYTKTVIATLVLASVAAIASADVCLRDAAALVGARAPMAKAITIAELFVNGKAIKAKFQEDRLVKGLFIYEVEVISGTRIFDVKIDASTALVLSAVEDLPDQADEDEDNDGDKTDGDKKDDK